MTSLTPAARAARVSRSRARRARLIRALERVTTEVGRTPVSVMHVCGSHEQAIAKFGLRASFPRGLDVIMGPGCPVCITDVPEVDEGVALARQGVRSRPTATCSRCRARCSRSPMLRPTAPT